MLNQFDWAERCLLVCTLTYYLRFRGHEAPGSGRGVDWEGAVITQEVYEARSVGTRFVAVCFPPDDRDCIPEPARGHTVNCLDSEPAYQALRDALLDQAGVQPGPVGTPKHSPRRRADPLAFATAVAPAAPSSAPRSDLPTGGRVSESPINLTTQPLAPGVLDWLASTLDHDAPIERVVGDLDEGRGAAHPGCWFYAFDACHADRPRALAEHLAVHLADRFRGPSP